MNEDLINKYVKALIKKIDESKSDIDIDAILKTKGLEPKIRQKIIKLVEEKISNRKAGKEDYLDIKIELAEEIKDKKETEDKPKIDNQTNKFIKQKNDLFFDESTNQEDFDSKIKLDEEFFTASNSRAQKYIGLVINEKLSTLALVSNSFFFFIGNFFKYLLLFLLHISIPSVIFLLGFLLKINYLVILSAPAFLLCGLIFLISLAKFISDEEGYINSSLYGLSHFIPVTFSLLLIKLFVESLFTLTSFSFVPITVSGEILALGFEAIGSIIVLIISTWYSLAFWVMINENEFYFYSIAKSRFYIKNNMAKYLKRIVVFSLIYLVLVMVFGSVFKVILDKSFGIKFGPDYVLSILDKIDMFFARTFSTETIQSILLLKFVKFEYFDILFIPIIMFIGFLFMLWPMVFYQMLYHDFSKNGKDVPEKLSKKHQSLFFITLILTPFIYFYNIPKAINDNTPKQIGRSIDHMHITTK